MTTAGRLNDNRYKYLALQWRKTMERRGWHSIRKGVPIKRVVEFHIIYRGELHSGRCKVMHLSAQDTYDPGTLAFLFRRTDQITEGVWRLPRDQSAELGWVIRDFDLGE